MKRRPNKLHIGIRLLVISTGLLALTSCSRSSPVGRPNFIAKLENKLDLGNESTPSRSLAASSPSCFKDRAQIAFIREEIAKLEAEQASAMTQPIEGKWREIDLSKLSRPQAEFLRQFGDLLDLPPNADISECSSVVCVLSQIYKKNGSEAPERIYHWYLKMGTLLVASRNPPNAESVAPDGELPPFSQVPQKKFLFTEQELYYFSLLTFLLPTKYQRMWSLRTIYRLPENYYPNPPVTVKIKDKLFKAYTSGDYGATYREQTDRRTGEAIIVDGSFKGFIRLASSLLRFDDKLPSHSQFGYSIVAHELSHAVDFIIDPSLKSTIGQYSSSASWEAISGWKRHTVRLDDKTQITIERSETGESPPTEYAGQTPAEDFAETAMLALKDPTALKKFPKRFEFITQNLFDGQERDDESVSRKYRMILAQETRPLLPGFVGRCYTDPNTYEASPSHSNIATAFNFSISNKMKDCLAGAIDSTFTLAIEDLRKNEPMACDYLSADRDREIRQLALTEVLPTLQQTIVEITQGNKPETVAPLLTEGDLDLKKFMSSLKLELDPREVFLHCLDAEIPRDCYFTRLGSDLTTLAEKFPNAPAKSIEEVKAAFFEQNKFEKIRERTRSSINRILIGVGQRIETVALERWKYCKTNALPIHKDDIIQKVLLEPYSGKTEFVEPDFITCINEYARGDVDKIVDTFLKEKMKELGEIRATKFLLYLQNMVMPYYVEQIHFFVTSGKQKS